MKNPVDGAGGTWTWTAIEVTLASKREAGRIARPNWQPLWATPRAKGARIAEIAEVCRLPDFT
ncbi:MAG: hypothetical protein IT536_14450 [Hyphomicrobiales bacterium]|nr:hypothetical protein [Hyphomicrobiales bacterium]